MKAASISELKKELELLPAQTVLELAIRITKYKKENKELLTYLLFEANDEADYIKNIKEEISIQFNEINKSNLHYVKKSLRKILRYASKYIKYSGNKQTEIEVLIFYCSSMRNSGIKIRSSQTVQNIYERQLVKIQKAITYLHEDIQYDYNKQLPGLKNY